MISDPALAPRRLGVASQGFTESLRNNWNVISRAGNAVVALALAAADAGTG